MSQDNKKSGENLNLNILLVGSEPEQPYLYARAFEENHVDAEIVFEGGVSAALRRLGKLDEEQDQPVDLIIADFRSEDDANARFLASLGNVHGLDMAIKVAFAPEPDAESAQILREAGADAVFARQWQFSGLTREVAKLYAFWLKYTQRVFV